MIGYIKDIIKIIWFQPHRIQIVLILMIINHRSRIRNYYQNLELQYIQYYTQYIYLGIAEIYVRLEDTIIIN